MFIIGIATRPIIIYHYFIHLAYLSICSAYWNQEGGESISFRDIGSKGDFIRKYYWGNNVGSRSSLLNLQNYRFKSLVWHAINKSPFYYELYRDCGIRKDVIPDLSISDLPIVDKKLLMDNYDLVVCNRRIRMKSLLDFIADSKNVNRKFLDRYVVVHTSGSSGKIGIYVYDDQDINSVYTLFFKYIHHAKPLITMLPRKVAFLGAVNGPYAAYTLIKRVRDYHIRFLAVSVEAKLGDIISKLNSFQPAILLAYSSMLSRIAESKLLGTLNIVPQAIYTVGEKLTPEQIDITLQAFGQKPRSIYGASESIIMGADTVHDEGMYLFNDWNIVETLDEMDQPVDVNQSGRAVLTNLYNYTMPIIRYRMDDVLSIDRNPQGKTLPYDIITTIEGRAEDFLELGNGDQLASIHPIVFVEFHVPGLKQLQIIKKSSDYFIARTVMHCDAGQVIPETRHRLQQILDNCGLGDAVRFDIEVVDNIPNDPVTGKFRLIVNKFK